MKVIIVGAGLGGLACGIACRKQGITVNILERAPELSEVGAGIQVPPNACRALDYIGLYEAVQSKADEILVRYIRRWDNGKVIATRAYGPESRRKYGYPALTIHRADLQKILLDAARDSGVEVQTNCEVIAVDSTLGEVRLSNGQAVRGDLIIGADGLWSILRNSVVGDIVTPVETGDLAYRGTFSREQLEALGNADVKAFCRTQELNMWLGPLNHAVFYPIRDGSLYNLVLLKPDDMKTGQKTEVGDLEKMLDAFQGWDPILTEICSCFSSVIKWKLCHHGELKTWVRGKVALLGDSAHPSLPYQSQGAAMAFQDAAVLGALLGKFLKTDPKVLRSRHVTLSSILQIYETVQKPYSTQSVAGAALNREMYHLPDGEDQERRDAEFANMSSESKSKWTWIDGAYQRRIIGTDLVKDALAELEKIIAPE